MAKNIVNLRCLQDIAETCDADIEKQIRDASAESQELLKSIYTVSSKLDEAEMKNQSREQESYIT